MTVQKPGRYCIDLVDYTVMRIGPMPDRSVHGKIHYARAVLDRPQYLVPRDQMALNIELGKLPAGTRLPSERKLQSDSGAARLTSSVSAMQPAQLLPILNKPALCSQHGAAANCQRSGAGKEDGKVALVNCHTQRWRDHVPRPDFKVQSDGGVDRGRRLIVLLRKLSPITQAEGKNE